MRLTQGKPRLGLFLIAALALTSFAGGLLTGPAELSPSTVVAALFDQSGSQAAVIVRDVRLPRALSAFLAGAMLGAAGAALQGLLRNPLADPGVLGVSSGAAFGAVLVIYFNLAAPGSLGVQAAAGAGALGVTSLLLVLGAGRVSTARLILVGVGLSSLVGALIALVMNLAPNPFVLSDLVNWLFGSVANRSLTDISLTAPTAAAGLALLLASGRGVSALALGEDAAASLGASVVRTRTLIITGSALLVGSSVALAGVVGFVGVVAPHLARPLVGHDPGRAILPSALIAGAIVSCADLFIRLTPFQQELKLGVAAALLGAPAFVLIAARTRRIAA